jgi:hypothetical protein
MAKGTENWITGQRYKRGDFVIVDQELYVCMSAHTAGINFFTDLATLVWEYVSARPRFYAISSNVTIRPNRPYLYLVDCWNNPVTITINSGVAPEGLEILFKKVRGSNPLTLVNMGGTLIDGQASLVIDPIMETVRMVYDTNLSYWWIV